MDVRQLEYFVAVADELNFTRAAARCHVVQSALSYQVARLERETGAVLFERSSRSVRLAPAGELLLPRARRILTDLDEARSELAALAGMVTGRLRMGVIGTTGTAATIIEATLSTFHQQHSAVEITIRDTGSQQMAEQVRAGTLDLAFVGLFADQVPADLAHRVLTEEPLVAVVPLDHPLAGGTSVRLEALAEHGSFVEMRPESGLRRQVDAAFERAGILRTVAFELNSSEHVVHFVGLGFGAALVPRSAALVPRGSLGPRGSLVSRGARGSLVSRGARGSLVSRGARGSLVPRAGLAVLNLDDPDALHPVSVIHRSPAPSAPSARRFLELLAENAGSFQ